MVLWNNQYFSGYFVNYEFKITNPDFSSKIIQAFPYRKINIDDT